MRVSIEPAGFLLAMLGVAAMAAMLSVAVLPVRWDSAPPSAVEPISSVSAVLTPLPSSPSWQEVGSMQIQPTRRLYDSAVSEINSASATAGIPVATLLSSSSTASPLLIGVAVILLVWLAVYVLGAILLGVAKGSLRLAGFLLTATLKCTLYLLNAAICIFKIILKMAACLLSVPLYLLKMAVRVPLYVLGASFGALLYVMRLPFGLIHLRSVQMTQQRQEQEQQQLIYLAPAGPEQPEEQPEEQMQPESFHQQGMDLLMMNLDAMTIGQLKNLVVEHSIGDANEFNRLLHKGTKADYVAFIRRSHNQM